MRGSGCNMLFKIVALFLVVMAVLAMFGKLRLPGKDKLTKARCGRCGRFRIGKGPCDCSKGTRR